MRGGERQHRPVLLRQATVQGVAVRAAGAEKERSVVGRELVGVAGAGKQAAAAGLAVRRVRVRVATVQVVAAKAAEVV